MDTNGTSWQLIPGHLLPEHTPKNDKHNLFQMFSEGLYMFSKGLGTDRRRGENNSADKCASPYPSNNMKIYVIL